MTDLDESSIDAWVTAHGFDDVQAAESIANVLRDAGIPVQLEGVNHRKLLGTVGAMVNVTMRVRARHLEDARSVIDAYLTGEDAEELPGDARPDARSPRMAAALAMVGAFFCGTLGFGHLYAHRQRLGVAIALGGWGCLFASVRGLELWPAWPLLLLVDAFGSARAARPESAETHDRDDLVTLIVALVAVGVALPLAAFLRSLGVARPV